MIDLILNNFNKLFKKINLYPMNIKDTNIFMRNQHFIDSLTQNNNCSKSSYKDLRMKLKRKLRNELCRNERWRRREQDSETGQKMVLIE